MNSDTIDIDICTDCLMAAANGLLGWDYDEEWLEAYETACETYGGDPIPTMENEEHGWQCEGHFSWNPCGFCGSKLGGDRYPAVLMERGK